MHLPFDYRINHTFIRSTKRLLIDKLIESKCSFFFIFLYCRTSIINRDNKKMLINSTINYLNNDLYDYSDHFPMPFDDETMTNQTYYDDYVLFNNQTFNSNYSDLTTLSSLLSFSSPFSYIFLILVAYLILTTILLSFSLYQQRQIGIENNHFSDSEEETEQSKRWLDWKQLLIGKITKGDMTPLLTNTSSDSTDEIESKSKTVTFPLQIV